jgi:hypothetical protein
MNSLLREVIPLALAPAISPVIVLLQLNTLTGEPPLARGLALTAGAAIVLIVVGRQLCRLGRVEPADTVVMGERPGGPRTPEHRYAAARGGLT